MTFAIAPSVGPDKEQNYQLLGREPNALGLFDRVENRAEAISLNPQLKGLFATAVNQALVRHDAVALRALGECGFPLEEPLLWAMEHGFEERVRQLCEAGAQLDLEKPGHMQIFKEIVASGRVHVLLPRLKSKNGVRNLQLLDCAAELLKTPRNRAECLSTLLAHGALFDPAAEATDKLLARCMDRKDPQSVVLLLDHGANPNAVLGGMSHLARAVRSGNPGIIRLIRDAGAVVHPDQIEAVVGASVAHD